MRSSTRCMLLSLSIAFPLLCVCMAFPAERIVPIRVTHRILVKTTQISQTQVDATYMVQVENLGTDATNVTAVVNSFTSAATVVQGNLTFPNIPAGGTALSTSTYTIQYDSGTKVDQNLIRFAFSAISTPVADAGPDRLIRGTCCKLNGGGSYDPFGLPLTYTWSVVSAPSGSTAVIQGIVFPQSLGVVAGFQPDLPGDYTIELVVNNGYHSSAPSYVHLSTTAVAPKADAGISQTVPGNATVQLDGTHSVNPMDRPLTYSWSFVSMPKGAHPRLSDPTSPQPTFVARVPGPYTLQLIVTDGALSSAPDTVTYTASIASQQNEQGNDDDQGNEAGSATANNSGNTPPHADAGPDLHIAENSYGFLAANRSTDSDGDFLTYRWAILSGGGSGETLDPVPNPDIKMSRYTVLHIELFVNDGHSESISTQVVSSEWLPPGFPQDFYSTVLPAFATVDPPATPGTVTLDGSLTQTSDEIDGTYWNLREAPAGSTAQLNSNGMSATITPDVDGLYIAQFQTDAGGYRNYPAAVSFLAHGGPPVANPGSTQFGLWTAPTLHTLDGSASWDPDGNALTYKWSLLHKPLGSNAVLSSATAVSPTFTADVDGTYIFQLVVNNGQENSAPAVVSVISKDSAPPVAYNIRISHPWRTDAVSVTLLGNDPLLDPYMYGYSLASVPSSGFITALEPRALFPFPPATYGYSGTIGVPDNNPDGQRGGKTIVYVPFSETFSGGDSFVYAVWDMGYPSGCFTPGNYCIAPKKSNIASVSIFIFEN